MVKQREVREWGPYLAIDLAYFYMQRHLRTRTSEDATNALTLAREFASKKDEIAGLDIAELVDSYSREAFKIVGAGRARHCAASWMNRW